MKNTESKYIYYAWIILGIAFLSRIFYASTFPLIPDETNYWQWSRYLDFGYYDQSPMIGWAIRFFTSFLDHTELAVRLPSICSTFITGIYIILLCRRYLSDKTAFHCMIAVNAILIFNAGAILATADALQALGWTGATYHLLKAYDEDKLSEWMYGGFWFGFGMLSKYSACLIGVFALLYGLSSAEKRIRLKSFKPYLGAIFGIIIFSPVILWNIKYDWASARHVLYLGGGDTKGFLHIKYLIEYIGSQAGVISPVIFFFIIAAWLKSIKESSWTLNYLFYTSASMIIFFALLSIHSRMFANWPSPGYIAGVILTCHYFAENREKIFKIEKRYIWYFGLILSFIPTILLLIQLNKRILPLPASTDRISREVSGWKEAGREAKKFMDSMPDKTNTFYFGLKYQTASELAFYTPGKPYTVCINKWSRPNVYDFWFKDKDLLKKDGIGLLISKNKLNNLKQVFESVGDVKTIKVYREGLFIREIYIVKCFGFKGGLRWKPKDNSDIRYLGP